LESLELRAMLDGTPMLPDLIPLADEAQGYMYDWSVSAVGGGRTRLFLTTATANTGLGPLELYGATANPDGTQDVMQRVFQSDGTHVDTLAGEFVYHPEHDHIHFEGYAEYNLRAMTEDQGVGDIVATGGKTSFCLIDLDDYDLDLPGAPSNSRYNSCGNRQGLSVGWEDIYHSSLPDQWIDVTDVAEGDYWLEVVVDPDNHIQELDDTNNVVRIPIELRAPEPLEADAYEPNNTANTASVLGAGSQQIEQLSIHEPDDDDWFAWEASEAGEVTITTHFRHSDGDVDLFVYDAARRLLDSSEGVENMEQVTLDLDANEKILIKVIGYSDATNPRYSLSIDAGEELILPDDFEPNDSLAEPAHLEPVSQTLTDLTFHSAMDEDYFRWTAPGPGTLRVTATIGAGGGELDLRMYNLLQQEVGHAMAGENAAVITLDQTPAGTLLYFSLTGAHGHAVPAYSLQINFVPRLPGDADGDGAVDLEDLNLVRNNFGATGENVPGDANFDGVVDLEDLNAVRNHFGDGQPGGAPTSTVRVSTANLNPARAASTLDVLSRIALSPSRPRRVLPGAMGVGGEPARYGLE
jgi:hypothetical protein